MSCHIYFVAANGNGNSKGDLEKDYITYGYKLASIFQLRLSIVIIGHVKRYLCNHLSSIIPFLSQPLSNRKPCLNKTLIQIVFLKLFCGSSKGFISPSYYLLPDRKEALKDLHLFYH